MNDDWSLVYVADPMCSWCHGFAPSLKAVSDRWPDLPVSLVMGGLRAQGELLDEPMKIRLRHHWDEVAKRSGQPFSEALFEREGFLYTTEPACRAVVAVRESRPELALAMFHAIQHAFYALGHDVTDSETLTDLAQSVGVDRAGFALAFEIDHIREATANDFAMTQRWGIRGFPCLIAARNNRAEVVSPGWRSPPDLLARLEALVPSPSERGQG